jgi:hypothetical protein
MRGYEAAATHQAADERPKRTNAAPRFKHGTASDRMVAIFSHRPKAVKATERKS